MTPDFVHLHVHSEYSLLDSPLRLSRLAERTAQLGMTAVALTDHNHMFGALQFVRACEQHGLKPILGCELNLCLDATETPPGHHATVLAAGQEGYANLVRLVSSAALRSESGRATPHVCLNELADRSGGLVVLSGCLGGVVAQRVLQQGRQAGEKALGRLKEALEPGRLFVELQDHGLIEQAPLNGELVALARAMDLPVVATNGVHLLEKYHLHAQVALHCIAGGTLLRDTVPIHHGAAEAYLKSPAEMAERFRQYPEALRNTLVVAEMCAGTVSPFAPPKLPRFEVPDGGARGDSQGGSPPLSQGGSGSESGKAEDEYLRTLARRGLEQRFAELQAIDKSVDREAYAQRLEHELGVIVSMGFAGYFLVVQDFIVWAKNHRIPVGPGRGSGAGSIVAWALRITNLDPIPYGLLFERFLNPERISMPDFDIDFCMSQRDRVIDYVKSKYGQESVGQIATFHQLKSRSVVRDVARVMEMSPAEGGRVASMIPEPVQGKTVPIAKAMEQEPRLKAAYEEPQLRDLLDTAMALENLTRHVGMHAAGVVISEGPLWDHVPIFCPEAGIQVTQYDKDDVEAAGLVKFDFLGLKTLTVLDVARDLVSRRPDRDLPLDLDRIPLNDHATFALLSSGETTNVFQLESSGMQALFRELRPDCFEDIVAAVALYRPGPLGSGMVEDFVQRKHGRIAIAYPHPCLREVLAETYGVIVYQEQVMEIAKVMAGYSLGQADLLRRAMGKKKPEEMAKQKDTFVAGAQAQGHPTEDAERIFDLMAYFSGYGFNKSHSAAYALLTYQTAYLKAHFPVEFMCATLSADKDKSDKVVRTIAEARAMGITVLPPDINESREDFTVVYSGSEAEEVSGQDGPASGGRRRRDLRDPLRPKIRFGLGAIKGVGDAAIQAVLRARRCEAVQGDAAPDRTPRDSALADRAATEATATKRTAVDGAAVNPAIVPFADLFDCALRVDPRAVGKQVFEALVQGGAFDSLNAALGIRRAQTFAAIDRALERGRKAAAERESGQTNLFAAMDVADGEGVDGALREKHIYPAVAPWDARERLRRERAVLGLYVTGHPLDGYQRELKRLGVVQTHRLSATNDGGKVRVAGMVEAYRERNSRSGRMAFFEIEDAFGRVEVIVRGRVLEQDSMRDFLKSADAPILLEASVQVDRGRRTSGDGSDGSGAEEAKLLLERAEPLLDALTERSRVLWVHVPCDLSMDGVQTLRRVLADHPGSCPVKLRVTVNERWRVSCASGLSVAPGPALLRSLEALFGDKTYELAA